MGGLQVRGIRGEAAKVLAYFSDLKTFFLVRSRSRERSISHQGVRERGSIARPGSCPPEELSTSRPERAAKQQAAKR